MLFASGKVGGEPAGAVEQLDMWTGAVVTAALPPYKGTFSSWRMRARDCTWRESLSSFFNLTERMTQAHIVTLYVSSGLVSSRVLA